MKTDYQLCIDFCEAEIVTRTSQIATVKDRGTFFAIVLHEIWPEIILYKPWRATAFDKARESFTGNDKTLYVEFRAWETLASLLGLKSAWVACADRLPEVGVWVWACFEDDSLPDGKAYRMVKLNKNGSWGSISYDQHKEAFSLYFDATHWQPLPARP